MDSDDAVDIIREMNEDKQEEVLSHIEDIEQAGDIVDLLKYDEDTAGGLMGTEMVIVTKTGVCPMSEGNAHPGGRYGRNLLCICSRR